MKGIFYSVSTGVVIGVVSMVIVDWIREKKNVTQPSKNAAPNGSNGYNPYFQYDDQNRWEID